MAQHWARGLAGAAVLAMVAGCSGSGESTSAPSPTPTTTPSPTPTPTPTPTGATSVFTTDRSYGSAAGLQTIPVDCVGGAVRAGDAAVITVQDLGGGQSGVRYSYQTACPTFLQDRLAPMAGFAELELTVIADTAMELQVSVSDADGALYAAAQSLAPGVNTVTLSPDDFSLLFTPPEMSAGRAAAKAARFDPDLSRLGFNLVDAAAWSTPPPSADDRNSFVLDAASVRSRPLADGDGDLVITGTATLAEAEVRRGNIVVEDGASLTISAPLFVLEGDLLVNNGEVAIGAPPSDPVFSDFGGAFVLAGQQLFERNIRVRGPGEGAGTGADNLSLTDLFISVPVQSGVQVEDDGGWAVTRSEVDGVFTVDFTTGAGIALTEADSLGEFIGCGTCSFTADESDGFLVWFTFPVGYVGELELPGGTVDNFSSSGFTSPGDDGVLGTTDDLRIVDVTVTNSTNVDWAIITTPLNDLTFRNSVLRAQASVFAEWEMVRDLWNSGAFVGITVDSSAWTEAEVSATVGNQVHTCQMPGTAFIADACAMRATGAASTFRTGVFEPGDRRLTFEDTQVNAWNVYVGLNGRLRVKDSTVGEAWGASDNGLLTVVDSVVDGSGGTLRALANTVVDIVDTDVFTTSAAVDSGYLRLRRSNDITRPLLRASVEASGNGQQCLDGIDVQGPVSVVRNVGDIAQVTLSGATSVQGPQSGPSGSIVTAATCPAPPTTPITPW